MAKFAYVDLHLDIVGDGRNDHISIAPISGLSNATSAPPAATTQTSPAELTQQKLTAGDNNVVAPGVIQTRYVANGLSPTYVIVIPPSNSANAKTLKGAAGDTGVVLSPALPLILAIPSTGLSTWAVVINSGGTETVEVWIV